MPQLLYYLQVDKNTDVIAPTSAESQAIGSLQRFANALNEVSIILHSF